MPRGLPAIVALAAGVVLPSSGALATPAFDPAAEPEAVFTSGPVLEDAEGLPTWDRVERLRDNEPGLFRQEDFPPGTPWADDAELAPYSAMAFGDPTPHGSRFLLHFAPGWLGAPAGPPVLLVSGALSSASGVMVIPARRLAAEGRAVFALSFAHPQGDNFQQAEQVADAILRIRELTGAEQVDLVAHSKGAVAAAVYLSNTASSAWSSGSGSRGAAYEQHGTPYRGDVRRFVPVGAPLGGLDTAFRWTANHLVTGEGGDPPVPSAWTTYYPFTTGNLFVTTDLSPVDLWQDGGDGFPGHAQVLARWDSVHDLPGARPSLGAYALQQDWLTTYEGGLGLMSSSRGIDDAIEDGGALISRLAGAGVDPSVEVAVLAGRNPLVPTGRPSVRVDPLGGSLGGFLGQSNAFYRGFLQDALSEDFPQLEFADDDIDGLRGGGLVLGEISGESDGVVFLASATDSSGLLRRGARLIETYVADLSHIDLLFASPELGAALRAQGEADPEGLGHLRTLGDRYIAADTIGWLARVLAPDDPVGDDDDDDSADDDDDSAAAGDDDDSALGDDDDSAGGPGTPWVGGCGCESSLGGAPAGSGAGALVALVFGFLRRRRAGRAQ